MHWPNQFAQHTVHLKRTAVRELLKLTATPGMISFAGGLPAPELFPVAELREAADSVLASEGARALQYGETEGLAELRDWIAQRHSTPQCPLSREHVVVTSGAQQALDLIGRILLDADDAVVVENPTYLALLSAWRPLGVGFLAVRSDAQGLCTDELEALASQRPKILYVVPNFQNPQGTSLELGRRIELVRWARRRGAILVEDDPYGDLRFEGAPLPSLLELDALESPEPRGGRHVIQVGTFSKTLAPGLRVGWVIAPPEVIDRLVCAKQAADLHTSTFNQYLVLHALRAGVLEQQLPRLCVAYRQRRDTMLAALEALFPPGTEWTRPVGGLFLMVRLPWMLDTQGLLAQALTGGVAFVPGAEFHLDGAGQNTMRLNYSNASPERIEVGMARLARYSMA